MTEPMERDVYIAFDHDGTVLSIVAAPTQDHAVAFWQGKGLIPHAVRCINAHFDTGYPVIEVLNTRTLTIADVDGMRRDPTRRERFRVVVSR